MSNIDKDIEILEELAEDTIRYKMVETDAYMAGAITRVIADRETWKKIAELLAEDKIIPKCRNCSDEDTHECTECILDWARKEVDSNEEK